MIFRWLEPGEFDGVSEVIAERGWVPLDPLSRVLVAEDGDELVGFIVLRLVCHTEPLFVSEGYRGTGVAEELSERMAVFMRAAQVATWVAVADSPFAEKLCEQNGMKRVESPVYVAMGEA